MCSYQIPTRQWDRAPEVSHPEPQIHARVAHEAEICSAARRVRDLAVKHGWDAGVNYARGTRPGRPPRVVDSIALRITRNRTRIWAVWLDGKFDTAQIWRPYGIPYLTSMAVVKAEIASEA